MPLFQSVRDWVQEFENCKTQGHTLRSESNPFTRTLGFKDITTGEVYAIPLSAIKDLPPCPLAEKLRTSRETLLEFPSTNAPSLLELLIPLKQTKHYNIKCDSPFRLTFSEPTNVISWVDPQEILPSERLSHVIAGIADTPACKTTMVTASRFTIAANPEVPGSVLRSLDTPIGEYLSGMLTTALSDLLHRLYEYVEQGCKEYTRVFSETPVTSILMVEISPTVFHADDIKSDTFGYSIFMEAGLVIAGAEPVENKGWEHGSKLLEPVNFVVNGSTADIARHFQELVTIHYGGSLSAPTETIEEPISVIFEGLTPTEDEVEELLSMFEDSGTEVELHKISENLKQEKEKSYLLQHKQALQELTESKGSIDIILEDEPHTPETGYLTDLWGAVPVLPQFKVPGDKKHPPISKEALEAKLSALTEFAKTNALRTLNVTQPKPYKGDLFSYAPQTKESLIEEVLGILTPYKGTVSANVVDTKDVLISVSAPAHIAQELLMTGLFIQGLPKGRVFERREG